MATCSFCLNQQNLQDKYTVTKDAVTMITQAHGTAFVHDCVSGVGSSVDEGLGISMVVVREYVCSVA